MHLSTVRCWLNYFDDIYGCFWKLNPSKNARVIRIYCWTCLFKIKVRQQNPHPQNHPKKISATFPVMIVLNKNCVPPCFLSPADVLHRWVIFRLENVEIHQQFSVVFVEERQVPKFLGRAPETNSSRGFPLLGTESISPTYLTYDFQFPNRSLVGDKPENEGTFWAPKGVSTWKPRTRLRVDVGYWHSPMQDYTQTIGMMWNVFSRESL